MIHVLASICAVLTPGAFGGLAPVTRGCQLVGFARDLELAG